MTTENMIRGRRTSPDTGVDLFGTEVTSSSRDGKFPEEVLLRLRGGGIFFRLDEGAFLSDSDETLAS